MRSTHARARTHRRYNIFTRTHTHTHARMTYIHTYIHMYTQTQTDNYRDTRIETNNIKFNVQAV